MLYLILLLSFFFSFAQKLYVVERERGAVAVVEGDTLKKEIRNLGNLNHATLKFRGNFAYLISRDGYISKIDTSHDKLLARLKVGNSAIGFTFCSDKVVVANYSPHTVVFLNEDLKGLHTVETGSRNVGIKSWKGKVLFSLMDKDEIWVMDCNSLRRIRLFRKVGIMPFDALLSGSSYVVGFFKESAVGILNIKDMEYRKVSFKTSLREVILKIPHFGLWGIHGSTAYIPAVGEKKIHVVNLEDLSYKGSIQLEGLPVFVSVSPDGRFVAVNYSGDREDFLSLIDRKLGKVIGTKRLGKRILHFRFTHDSKFIYLSSYYENKIKKISLPHMEVLQEISVPTPSGVFLKGG